MKKRNGKENLVAKGKEEKEKRKETKDGTGDEGRKKRKMKQ